MTDDDRAQLRKKALLVLQDGLRTMRHVAGFRKTGYLLNDDARAEITRLADAMHNIPEWVSGVVHFDGRIAADISATEHAISGLKAIPCGSSLLRAGHPVTDRAGRSTGPVANA